MSGPVTLRRGFVLGKFMPPHAGHVHLCRFAQGLAEELSIMVCSLESEPIPGALRVGWMRALFPDARVLWCTDDLPQEPKDDPEGFWNKWRAAVRRHHPEPIDLVCASESYGQRLADELDARFAPCDPVRVAVPCSGSAIRADPYANWAFIPDVVRPYYVKRVCVFGPESSGKTTLAVALADRLGTALAPEYGRTYTEVFGTALVEADLMRIVEGHRAGVAAAKRRANRVLIEDTDPLLTAVWSDMLFGRRDPWFATFDDLADLYLLCDIDIPWEDDGTRYFPDAGDRARFARACESELKARGARHVTLAGPLEARLALAVEAVERLLGGR